MHYLQGMSCVIWKDKCVVLLSMYALLVELYSMYSPSEVLYRFGVVQYQIATSFIRVKYITYMHEVDVAN